MDGSQRKVGRIRPSLLEVQAKWESGEDPSLLNNLIKAFRGIQKLDPSDFNSFFEIAGYHGEPFRGKGAENSTWWGGYCNHENVLFPTWHRAYTLRLENALRSISGCENVTLPFFDELAAISAAPKDPISGDPTDPIPDIIPWVLTEPKFPPDGIDDNPLYSYKLQRELVELVKGTDYRYSKHVGYETVRFPLAGLVGTDKDRANTKVHNEKFENHDIKKFILNDNLRGWLTGEIVIQKDPEKPVNPPPKTYSVLSRFKKCLDAPNYTIFSNTTSQVEAIKKAGGNPDVDHWFVSLESPHNAIHLALGGFYYRDPEDKAHNSNPQEYLGANGDMGDNETASFDPIFFFHHSFIDLVFWRYQQKMGMTEKLEIDESDRGATRKEGMPNSPPQTQLTMESPLEPFRKPDGSFYTPNDVTNCNTQLDYDYGPSSIDALIDESSAFSCLVPGDEKAAPIKALAKAENIDRAKYPGSFVVRTYAKSTAYPDGIEIGREAILSRWNLSACANCQSHLSVDALTPVDSVLLDNLRGGNKDTKVTFQYKVQTHGVRDDGGGFMSVGDEMIDAEGQFWD